MKSTVQLLDFESATETLWPEDCAKNLRQVSLAGITLERLEAAVNQDAIVPGNTIQLQIFRDFSPSPVAPNLAGILLSYTIS